MRVALLIVLAGCISTSMAAADPPAEQADHQDVKPETKEMSVWMRKKMDYSQAILKGLAMGDFEAIEVSAAQMYRLNKVEGFIRRRNPRYTMYVREFERISNELVEQAKEENLAGVTLTFNQMTVNCVNCHREMRKAETKAAKPGSSPIDNRTK